LTPTFFGHPRGLATLFFTEMWERFTYYGMRAVLVLFLVAAVTVGGFGINDRKATAIYGLYTAGVYLAALPGGWIADRLIGAQRAVLAGGLAITFGNALLAMSTSPQGFYVGLVVIVLGVGLLKPNVSAIVADLYPEGGARLDSGFTIFYIGINVGGFLGPLVTGAAQVYFGLRAGFAAASFFMAVGVVQFYLTRRHLGTAGAYVAPIAARDTGRALQWLYLWVAVGVSALVLAAVSFGLIPVNAVALAQAVTYAILGMAVLYFAYYFIAAGLDAEERRRGIVLVVLFVGSALFWSGYEQAGSSLNLFAERYTNRTLESLHFVIPPGWFQSLN
jgi:POT family proton-dependent oligopeptide transporter